MKHIILATLLTTLPLFADPLPSWNNTAAKESVTAFIEKVTTPDSDGFVPVAERIAVFDNDGCLWTENPIPIQAAFAFSELERLLPANPDWNDEPAVQAFKKRDIPASTVPTTSVSISPCSSCWPISAPTISRPGSSPVAARISCASSPRKPMASRPNKSSDRTA